jgi:hypothetical protein
MAMMMIVVQEEDNARRLIMSIDDANIDYGAADSID